ncbi:hypothetical protein LTR66_016933, partial [Elasticomyces elasticus]
CTKQVVHAADTKLPLARPNVSNITGISGPENNRTVSIVPMVKDEPAQAAVVHPVDTRSTDRTVKPVANNIDSCATDTTSATVFGSNETFDTSMYVTRTTESDQIITPIRVLITFDDSDGEEEMDVDDHDCVTASAQLSTSEIARSVMLSSTRSSLVDNQTTDITMAEDEGADLDIDDLLDRSGHTVGLPIFGTTEAHSRVGVVQIGTAGCASNTWSMVPGINSTQAPSSTIGASQTTIDISPTPEIEMSDVAAGMTLPCPSMSRFLPQVDTHNNQTLPQSQFQNPSTNSSAALMDSVVPSKQVFQTSSLAKSPELSTQVQPTSIGQNLVQTFQVEGIDDDGDSDDEIELTIGSGTPAPSQLCNTINKKEAKARRDIKEDNETWESKKLWDITKTRAADIDRARIKEGLLEWEIECWKLQDWKEQGKNEEEEALPSMMSDKQFENLE